MSKTFPRPRIKRTEKEKLDLIEQWEQSGLSIKGFCDQHAFSDSLFHGWLNKYRRQKKVKAENTFVPVQITAPSTLREDNPSLFAEVFLASGSCIRIYQPVSVDFLRTLLS
jgi:transposase-like protein